MVDLNSSVHKLPKYIVWLVGQGASFFGSHDQKSNVNCWFLFMSGILSSSFDLRILFATARIERSEICWLCLESSCYYNPNVQGNNITGVNWY